MTTNTIYATRHGLERAMERIDLNRKEAIYNINLALHKGKSYEQYNTTKEKEYLQKHSIDVIALAFDKYCYIFSYQGECITVYPLPEWWEKKVIYNGKERIKKPKKFFTLNQYDYNDKYYMQ